MCGKSVFIALVLETGPFIFNLGFLSIDVLIRSVLLRYQPPGVISVSGKSEAK